jgi:hypothetical protein
LPISTAYTAVLGDVAGMSITLTVRWRGRDLAERATNINRPAFEMVLPAGRGHC